MVIPSLNLKLETDFLAFVGTAFWPAIIVISDKALSTNFLSWVALPTPWFKQTFVIVTHNQDLANMADRKLTMIDGKMVG